MSEARIAAVACGDSSGLDRVLAIYREAFPEDERKPDDEVREMFGDERCRIDIAYVGSEVVGFAICREIGRDLSLLEYMAIDDVCRGQGLGGSLFEHVKQATGEGVLLLEVESVAASEAQQNAISRRKEFYRAHGCLEVSGLKFVMPLHGNAEPTMSIMAWGNCLPRRVAKVQVRSWISDLYASAYRIEASDPRIAAMIDPLDREVVLA